ncbi:MAG: hypothetical protein M3144_03320, partial [Actinomycetota bacterium]|nr:hypothetical protein [Actinomycetota bacterium]
MRAWCRWVTGICGRAGGLPLLALVNLVALVVLRRLNAALELLHLPDRDGRGMSDLAKGMDRAQEAVSTWTFIGERLRGAGILARSGQSIAVAHALVDLLFAVAYVSLLALIVLALFRRLEEGRTGSAQEQALRIMLLASFLVLPLVFLAEVAENVLRIVVVFDQSALWTGALWAIFRIKVLVLIAAVAPLLPAVFVRVRSQWNPVRLFFSAASLLRVQMVLIAAFALLVLVGPTADQFQDSLRSWSTEVVWAFAGILAVLAFSITTGVTAWRLVAEAGQRQRKRLSIRVMAFVGIALLALGAFLTWTRDQGEGLLVAGGVLVVLALLSVPIASFFPSQAPAPEFDDLEEEASAAEESPAIWRALPGYLAAVPLIVLGVAMVNAVIPEILGGGP